MADWLAADWPALPGVHAGTTLRGGGVSTGHYRSLNLGAHVGDEPARVAENRARLRRTLALPSEPHWLEQVHGRTVARLPEDSGAGPSDAAVTRQPGIVCAVLTADCLPVVLARRDGRAVGVAHAGWRGLKDGVLEAAVNALGGGEIIAWLGPAISPAAYEVGDDVREAFVAGDPADGSRFAANPRGRWQADLYGLARRRLAAAGVGEVYGGGFCTLTDEARFFSYRRDGQCGRMATFAWIEPSAARGSSREPRR